MQRYLSINELKDLARDVLERAGMTHQDAAKTLGVSRPYVTMILRSEKLGSEKLESERSGSEKSGLKTLMTIIEVLDPDNYHRITQMHGKAIPFYEIETKPIPSDP